MGYWHRDRPINQWNRIETPERNSQIHGLLIHNNDAKVLQNRLFKKWCRDNWILTCKKIKWDAYLIPYTDINSIWIRDLYLRPHIINSEQN